MTKLLGSCDPLILGMLEHLGVELPLGVLGEAAMCAHSLLTLIVFIVMDNYVCKYMMMFQLSSRKEGK